MRRTRIKICGICRPEDAAFAADCGADAIGMVFHAPSPRSVSVDQARAILRVVPPFVTPVALFVDASTDQILDTARSLGVSTVQLHGHEPPELIAALKPLTILKAVKVERSSFSAVLADWKREIVARNLDNLRGVLLETGNTPEPGGSGLPNDWEAVREAQSAHHFDGLPPIIAAGGLTPQNVAQVVRTVRPYAVDVSSGVEEVRREKSQEKIRLFIRAVREG